MRSLESRLIISHILPVLIVVPLVGLILIYLLETQIMLTQMSGDISDKANLIAETVNGRPELLQDINQAETFIDGVSIYIEEQVFLFGPEGEIVASNEAVADSDFEDLAGDTGLEKAAAGEENLVIIYGLAEQRAIVLVPVQDINRQLVGIVAVTDTLASTANQFQRLRTIIAGALAFQLVLGALIGYLLARRLEKPINRAASAVVAISRGEQINPVPIGGPEEIQDLSEAVNILSDRLRLLEETRQRSLANIVHELGRPLGAINTATYVLRQGAGDDPQVRDELLAGIESAVLNMEPLLNDLAQLYGQGQGSIQLNLQPVNLNEWLLPSLLPWRTVAREKGLNWQTDFAEELPIVEIDPERMNQVIGNLISNAIKYTPQGGAVTVTADADPGMITIAVCDTGLGIDLEEQERIFEPFYRSQAHRRFPQGLGLGLTIARDLVEAHGGTLDLVSAPGEGSCFTVHLPG
jgi:two-component system, OmpR family, sensor histidine kinase BaeS